MADIIFSEDSHVADSVYGNFQYPIKSIIEKRAEAFEAESLIDSVFSMQDSTHFAESYGSMTSMNDFEPVGENGAYPTNGMEEGYFKTVQNVTWKSMFSVSEEMIEDAQTIDLKQKPQQFVTAYYRTRERFAARMYGEAMKGSASFQMGKQTFDLTTADELPLFSKSHKSKKMKGVQSNAFADAFSVDALAQAESCMQNFMDDNGNILNIAPDTILIPNDAALKKAVMAAVGSDKDPNSNYNAFNNLYGRWNVICWPYLNQFIAAGSAPWVVLDSQYLKDNLAAVFQTRKKLTVHSKVEDNDANTWKGRARYNCSFVDWRFACCGGFTGGTQLIGA